MTVGSSGGFSWSNEEDDNQCEDTDHDPDDTEKEDCDDRGGSGRKPGGPGVECDHSIEADKGLLEAYGFGPGWESEGSSLVVLKQPYDVSFGDITYSGGSVFSEFELNCGMWSQGIPEGDTVSPRALVGDISIYISGDMPKITDISYNDGVPLKLGSDQIVHEVGRWWSCPADETWKRIWFDSLPKKRMPGMPGQVELSCYFLPRVNDWNNEMGVLSSEVKIQIETYQFELLDPEGLLSGGQPAPLLVHPQEGMAGVSQNSGKLYPVVLTVMGPGPGHGFMSDLGEYKINWFNGIELYQDEAGTQPLAEGIHTVPGESWPLWVKAVEKTSIEGSAFIEIFYWPNGVADFADNDEEDDDDRRVKRRIEFECAAFEFDPATDPYASEEPMSISTVVDEELINGYQEFDLSIPMEMSHLSQNFIAEGRFELWLEEGEGHINGQASAPVQIDIEEGYLDVTIGIDQSYLLDGSPVTVKARALELSHELSEGQFFWGGIEIELLQARIVPGLAKNFDVEVDCEVSPNDGSKVITGTISNITGPQGNLITDTVYFDIDLENSLGTLDELNNYAITGGSGSFSFTVGDEDIDEYKVLIELGASEDGMELELSHEPFDLSIALDKTSVNVLSQDALVEATVTASPEVSDGTPVEWDVISTARIVQADPAFQDNQAKAVFDFSGALEDKNGPPGLEGAQISVQAGQRYARSSVLCEKNGLSFYIEDNAIAGDQIADGVVDVPFELSEESGSISYNTATTAHLSGGAAFATVAVDFFGLKDDPSYWPMNEVNGSQVEDVFNPGENFGTLHGAVTWLNEQEARLSDGALSFGGSPSDYMTIDHNPNFFTANSYDLQFSILPEELPSDDEGYVLVFKNNDFSVVYQKDGRVSLTVVTDGGEESISTTQVYLPDSEAWIDIKVSIHLKASFMSLSVDQDNNLDYVTDQLPGVFAPDPLEEFVFCQGAPLAFDELHMSGNDTVDYSGWLEIPELVDGKVILDANGQAQLNFKSLGTLNQPRFFLARARIDQNNFQDDDDWVSEWVTDMASTVPFAVWAIETADEAQEATRKWMVREYRKAEEFYQASLVMLGDENLRPVYFQMMAPIVADALEEWDKVPEHLYGWTSVKIITKEFLKEINGKPSALDSTAPVEEKMEVALASVEFGGMGMASGFLVKNTARFVARHVALLLGMRAKYLNNPATKQIYSTYTRQSWRWLEELADLHLAGKAKEADLLAGDLAELVTRFDDIQDFENFTRLMQNAFKSRNNYQLALKACRGLDRYDIIKWMEAEMLQLNHPKAAKQAIRTLGELNPDELHKLKLLNEGEQKEAVVGLTHYYDKLDGRASTLMKDIIEHPNFQGQIDFGLDVPLEGGPQMLTACHRLFPAGGPKVVHHLTRRLKSLKQILDEGNSYELARFAFDQKVAVRLTEANHSIDLLNGEIYTPNNGARHSTFGPFFPFHDLNRARTIRASFGPGHDQVVSNIITRPKATDVFDPNNIPEGRTAPQHAKSVVNRLYAYYKVASNNDRGLMLVLESQAEIDTLLDHTSGTLYNELIFSNAPNDVLERLGTLELEVFTSIDDIVP